jgi:hypothetical protein
MWGEVTRIAQLGRDRTIDVVPSGEGAASAEEIGALLRRDATRIARQYDAIVLVGAVEQVVAGLASAMPVPDVIYCVRVGRTPVAELKRVVEEIERTGAHARGVVLWDAPDPILAELRPMEEVEREAAGVS